jgi:hypothetical protein
MAKHAQAFSTASTLVIDNSENAYTAAIALRQQEQVTASIYAYDTNPSWSPYTDTKPLITPEQLNARITVLNGLKAYADSLVTLTGAPKATSTSAEAAGASLKALDTSLAADFPTMPKMSPAVANRATTAILALENYLISRKVKGSLPHITQQMNTNIEAICNFLNSDIVILRRQADVDYQALAVDQDAFIRHSGTSLNPIQRRDEIRTLIGIADQQKANDLLLQKLQTALHTLDLTHQALAAAAQGNDPESIKQKLAELTAAGQDLGTFYQSLSK